MPESKDQKGQLTESKTQAKWDIEGVTHKTGDAVEAFYQAVPDDDDVQVVEFVGLVTDVYILADGEDPDSDFITDMIKDLRSSIPEDLRQALGIAK